MRRKKPETDIEIEMIDEEKRKKRHTTDKGLYLSLAYVY